ncbi:GIY-YIG nuclease family protein [Aquimarina brevivitae]|uniref:GIY-YIG nuclease family protein n=1 Tax=Aquimarina brevivitae TaxID=323412 RepID=UPI001F5F6EFE|nr:GIY-YIG nuclease family protein [Aquimarina brevivitae]
MVRAHVGPPLNKAVSCIEAAFFIYKFMSTEKEIGCYILSSQKINKFYIGACQENLNQRIQKHNTSFYGKKSYTSITNDWTLYLFIPTKTYTQAIAIEQKIKAMKSRTYIQNLKKYPEMVEKLMLKTSST